MKAARQDTERTRNSLLAAANEIFSTKGYRDATVAEISERAGVNVAAINYHFGDKETLYRETWRNYFRECAESHPLDGGVGADRPPRERLEGLVLAILRKVTDEVNRGYLIVYMELVNPTGLLEEVAREELRPLRQTIAGIVREILGPLVPEVEVRFCATSIMNLSSMPLFLNRMEINTSNNEEDSWGVKDVDAYAKHVVNFSLGGMDAIRNYFENITGVKD